MAPPVGAVVAEVSAASPVAVAERVLVREPEVVEVRVCELKVVLREMGTPVPIEVPVPMEVMVEFIVAGARVEVPE